ncbi:MAG: VCBS repeat-containing protein, partial [Planctomycetota bacterium]
ISNSFPPYDDWRDQIYFGTGSGIEIVPGWVSSLQTHTGDVQIGDINADGRPDAVTVHGGGVRSDHVRVYFGADGMPSTTEGFTSSFSQRGWGTSGVVFDIDDDGDLDVFTTNQGLSPDPFRPMTLYRNLGTGLATMPDWISSERSIQGGASVGDADGDGDLDIGVSRWANFFTGIIENNGGTPSEVPALFAVNTDSTDRGTAFADIDGDGDDDFAVGGADGPEVYDNAAGVFSSAWVGTPPFTGVQDFGAFDVDGDGDEDIVEIHFSDGRAHIYENVRGALDVAPTWTFDAPEVGTAIAVGDLNGDGRADLALGYAGNTSIRVFYAEAPDCPADLAFPFGVVDLSDVDAFIVAFVVGDSLADLAVPFGFVDLSDVDAFIASFVAGCP